MTDPFSSHSKSAKVGIPLDAVSGHSPKWLIPMLLFTMVTVWIFICRYYYLDDTFIYLFFGRAFRTYHVFTVDGETISFQSSTLFVLLASLADLLPSPPIAIKLLSIASYLALLAIVSIKAARATSSVGRWNYLLILAAISSPQAARWFSSGMETSLFCVLAVILGAMCESERRVNPKTLPKYLGLVALGCAAVMLRTESLYLIVVVTIFFMVRDAPTVTLNKQSVFALAQRSAANSHLLIGAILGAGILLACFGHIYPDTGVAKSGLPISQTIYLFGFFIGSAMTFGILSSVAVVMTSLSVIISLSNRDYNFRVLATAGVLLAAFPIGFVLIAIKGIQIQGIRHIIWLFLFSSIALSTYFSTLQNSLTVHRRSYRFIVAIVKFTIIAGVLIWPFEALVLAKFVRGLEYQWDRAYPQVHWEALSGSSGMASDVGRILYYSNARICDGDGLVNGRMMSMMSTNERLQECKKWHPTFMYANAGQYAAIQSVFGDKSFAGWRICFIDIDKNLLASNWPGHMLIVAPDEAKRVCPSENLAIFSSGALPIQEIRKFAPNRNLMSY